MHASEQTRPHWFRKLVRSFLKRYCGLLNRYTDLHVAFKPDFLSALNRTSDFDLLYREWVRQNPLNDRCDLTRLYMLYLQVESLEKCGVEGAFAELGVFRGTTAKLFRLMAPSRELFLFDTFEGFSAEDVRRDAALSHARTGAWAGSLAAVKAFVGEQNTRFIQGRFPETAAQVPPETRFALMHLDADLYAPQLEGLRFFYPRMVPRATLIVHDCNNRYTGSRKALDEFLADKPESPVFIPDKSGSAVLVRCNR